VVELLKRRREQLSWVTIGVGRGMNNLPFSKPTSRSLGLNLREEGAKTKDACGEAKGSIAVSIFYQSWLSALPVLS
jgi:hypothetical protein